MSRDLAGISRLIKFAPDPKNPFLDLIGFRASRQLNHWSPKRLSADDQPGQALVVLFCFLDQAQSRDSDILLPWESYESIDAFTR